MAMQTLISRSPIMDEESKVIHISSGSIVVKAGVSFRLPFIIERKNSMIIWEFKTMEYSVLFGIAKTNKGQEIASGDYVHPIISYLPDQKHFGSIKIEECGDYALIWDNTHSWIRDRIIVYNVDMKLPERTSEECYTYSQNLFAIIRQHTEELYEMKSEVSEKELEKGSISKERLSLTTKMEHINNDICNQDGVIAGNVEEINELNSNENEMICNMQKLRSISPFLLEGDRIFGMLTGVDLLHIACVNSFLHRAVYQDGVWNRVFYQEDVIDLAAVLQNETLRTKYQIVNPDPRYSDSERESVTEVKTVDEVRLQDLSLLYKITEKQGWFKNRDDQCFFLRFKDAGKKQFDVIFPCISSVDLDSLIRQTLKSTVLIPMPGTEAGKSGFYIDRFRRVSKWSVEVVKTDGEDELKWQELPL